VWLNRRVAGALVGYEPVNSWILIVKLNAKPRCISLMQIYASTSVADEEQIELFYQELAAVIKKVPARDILLTIVSGDFNATAVLRWLDNVVWVRSTWLVNGCWTFAWKSV